MKEKDTRKIMMLMALLMIAYLLIKRQTLAGKPKAPTTYGTEAPTYTETAPATTAPTPDKCDCYNE